MDGNHSSIEGDSISRAGSGAQPPQLSLSEPEAPPSVQSALREVRPDDLDAIFDGALFGPPTLEAVQAEEVAGGAVAAPVPVGAMDWYMERNEQPAGPFRLERLRELWHQGEFDPDTLFWCEAWTNWRPLSHVPELVAAMTISGLPTVAADASVSSVRAKEPGSEKKVVSALHSLVQQEETWLRKQEEEKEQAKEEARLALLDAPSAPVPLAPVVPVAPPMQPVVAPVAPVATGGLLGPIPVPPPHAGVPVAPYPGLPMAPPLVPAMMAVPVPPEAFAPVRRGRMFLAGALIGSAVAGVIVGAMMLLPQVRRAPEQVTAVAPQPIPVPVAAAQPSAPVVAQTPPPAPAPAPVVAAAPAVQPAAPVAQPPAPQPEVVASKVVAAPAQHEKPKSVVVAASASEERIARVAESASQRRQQPPPAPVAPVSTEPRTAVNDNPPAVDPTNFDDSIDQEFERELGFAKGAPKHTPEDPRSSRSVYVPPEPGKDVPDSLSTSDIVQVVSAHKEAILACIDTHEPERMSDSGKDKFVVRWRVQPSGSAIDVAMETEALKGTPFARCIEGQVRSWKFPQHRVQSREPVRFPFTY
ncbi:AgmX/PglI C-terminal domain-containing protein [Archangium violaceum]|uniref:GYF domain-containing protein n=1 Tax=Archangium violaceum TaxID=83451 RepID=UPI002B31464D|nr:AgmX/PglI C-terminal domain-containing protein [Archangium violaceum]